VVDDDRLVREMTRDVLLEERFEVDTVQSPEEAIRLLGEREPYDIVITDLSMPGMDGLELMQKVKTLQPRTEVIVLTGFASLESALRALRLGAADYLRKPVEGPEIAYCVKRTVLRRRLLAENESLRYSLRAFESSRVLAACLESADVLPLTLDVLLQLLARGRAVGRITLGESRHQESLCLRGFDGEQATAIRELVEAGKLFDPGAVEGGSDPASARRQLAEIGLHGDLMVLPIRLEARTVGAVWLFSDAEPFDERDRGRAELVVQQAELALLNSEKLLQAREKAFVDDVTELYNARYLLSALDREVSRAQRYGLELSVLFLDLDFFKRVNDRHGHIVGSRVLRELGRLLLGCVRSIDSVGRYGGDEFTVLLVDTGASGALNVAERIRRTVADAQFGGRDGLQVRVTVSIGTATYPGNGTTWQQLLDQADKAMYLAKSRGRNRTCTAEQLVGG
jgi:diguanylate cyclase (GGDEF)-like protein